MREGALAASDAGTPLRLHGAPSMASASRDARFAGWDLLLVCVAVYVATTVGRIHQLFPILLPLKPTMVAAALAVCLYTLVQSGPRRIDRVRSRTTTCLVGLLLWAALCVPTALNQGVAFDFLKDFLKTGVMCIVLAGSVRSARDVERLILVYFGVTVVYAAVVLSRFQLGPDDWRLSKLYSYDANDFATLIVSAMPLGLSIALAR